MQMKACNYLLTLLQKMHTGELLAYVEQLKSVDKGLKECNPHMFFKKMGVINF